MTSSLTLEVSGKSYTIPSPPARIGLALQAAYVISQARRAKIDPPVFALERAARYDDLSHTLDEDALGPAWDVMVEDDVSLDDLRRAARAAFAWVVTGSETAARLIMSPETPSGEVASGPKASTTTDGAPTIPRPDSSSSTTSPPTNSSD